MPELTHYIIARFATVEACWLGLDGALNGSFGAAQSDMETAALSRQRYDWPDAFRAARGQNQPAADDSFRVGYAS